MKNFRNNLRAHSFACAAIAFIAHTASARAQTPIPKTAPGMPTVATLGLPPGPTVSDWQPRGRAVIGGTIVISGQNLRPAELEAAIGSANFKLPVRLSTSTSSRIELEVPDGALGKLGKLAVGYPGTQGTIVEANYRIDAPTPSIVSASAGASVTPFLSKNLVIDIKEFPGDKINLDNVTISGPCAFKKRSGISYGSRDRDADLSMRVAIQGWFENSGNCQLQVSMKALSSTGATITNFSLTTPFTVAAPQQYVFDNTQQLTDRLQASLVHAGLGNFCESPPNNGVRSFGSDFGIIASGGPVDVSCVFKTKEWVLPPGVRLAEIGWRTSHAGIRCGTRGSFTHTFPTIEYSLNKGAVVVRPDADQPETDFFAFGENSITVDGVTFASNLNGPRTMIKQMLIGIQCVSSLTVLTNASGTHGPTTDPQSFAIILSRIVLEGPPGMSTADLLK